mgnify:CR=1 FL=1
MARSLRTGRVKVPTLGEVLRELRQHRALTEERLASDARVTVDFIRDVEGDRRSPTGPVLMRLARRLGTSLDRLLVDE